MHMTQRFPGPSYFDKLVFIDAETTGLNPNEHAVLEVSYAVGAFGPVETFYPIVSDDRIFIEADPVALELNQFIERHRTHNYNDENSRWYQFKDGSSAYLNFPLADESDFDAFIGTIDGKYWVGANPTFDIQFISALYSPERLPYSRAMDISSWAGGIMRSPERFSLKHIINTLDNMADPEYAPFNACNYMMRGDHTSKGDVQAMREAYFALLAYAAEDFTFKSYEESEWYGLSHDVHDRFHHEEKPERTHD